MSSRLWGSAKEAPEIAPGSLCGGMWTKGHLMSDKHLSKYGAEIRSSQ